MNLDLDLSAVRFTRRKQGYVMLTLVFAVIGMLAQTAAVMLGYDAALHVYKAGHPLGTFVGWGLAVMTVVLLSSFVSLRRDTDAAGVMPCDNLTAFFASMGGGALIVASLLLAWETKEQSGTIATVTVLLAAASVPTGLYLILTAMSRDAGSNRLTALGFFPVIWLSLCLMRSYFESNSAINDPLRILYQLSLAAMMLAFLGELKLRVGKKGQPLFFAAAGASVLLGSVSALSMILIRLVVYRLSDGELLLSIAELILCFYFFLRLYRMAFGIKEPEKPFVREDGFES